MRFARALVLALILVSGWPAGTGSQVAYASAPDDIQSLLEKVGRGERLSTEEMQQVKDWLAKTMSEPDAAAQHSGRKSGGKPKPPKPDEGEWVRVPAYGTIDATASVVSRATVPDPPRSSVEFSGDAEAAGSFTLQGADANGKQRATFTLKGSGQSGMHGGASIDCRASASGQGPVDLAVMVNWKQQKYRFRIRFPSVRGQMRCVTTAPHVPQQEDAKYYSPSIPIPSWKDGELQRLRVDPAAADLLARIGPQSHTPYDLEGWIEGSLRGKSMSDRFVTDVYENRGGSAPGIAFMGLAESWAGQDVPAHVTVSWGLSLDPRRAEGYLTALLPGPDEYKKWIPKAGKNEDEPGSVVSFVVAERKPGTVDTPPDHPRKFKVRFELVDVSSEPGICLNFPAKSAAKKTPDLRFPENENANDYEISNEGKTAVSKRVRERHDVFVASYDYGAYGKLQAKLLFDEGEVPASVVHLPDLPYVSLPYDENGNHIADQWEIDKGVFKDNRPEDWDGESDPSGQATNGDGLSLYEEYRGAMVWDKHKSFDPKQKKAFVFDDDDLLKKSHFEKESGLKVYYVFLSEINYMDSGEDQGTINFNHKTAHLHPKYAIRVIKDMSHHGRYNWGNSDWRENKYHQAEIHVGQIIEDMNAIAHERSADIAKWRAAATPAKQPLTQAEIDKVVQALIRVATMHEVGHTVGIDHHHEKVGPIDLNDQNSEPGYGNLGCVMRYPWFGPKKSKKPPADGSGQPVTLPAIDEVPAFLAGYQEPTKFCRTPPSDCYKQINVKWFGN